MEHILLAFIFSLAERQLLMIIKNNYYWSVITFKYACIEYIIFIVVVSV